MQVYIIINSLITATVRQTRDLY